MARDVIAKRLESIERQIADLKHQLAQVRGPETTSKIVNDRFPNDTGRIERID